MLLLDTHAFVWLASDQRHLPPKAKEAIHQHGGSLFLSAISALEIAILVKRNRLALPLPPEAFIDRALAQHGISEIPVTRDIACHSASLPDIHNDPFDRIIVATAGLRKLVIVSKDSTLARYPGTRVVWD
jgi:PIN domain nuclease of toxin-antitoxin system